VRKMSSLGWSLINGDFWVTVFKGIGMVFGDYDGFSGLWGDFSRLLGHGIAICPNFNLYNSGVVVTLLCYFKL
jgi:hypothetical protein